MVHFTLALFETDTLDITTVKSCEQLEVHLVDPVIYSFPAKAMLFYIISSVIHAF